MKLTQTQIQDIEEWFEPEFLDIILVIKNGSEKHGRNNYLLPESPTLRPINNFGSLMRHALDYLQGNLVDKDSGLHPGLHGAARNLMAYTRHKRNIYCKDEELKLLGDK